MDRKMKNVLREYLDELPPTQEVVDLYKSKLERCRRDYDAVLKHLDRFKVELEDRRRLDQKLHATEQELHSVKALFSRTQALLLKERSNAQQMALHIDILRKQHEMDREKLDLMLSLNGRPTPNLFQGELVLRQQIYKMDCLMKEQGSSLLEERSLLKAEWDRDRRCSENMLKSLRLKVQKLQDQLVVANEQRALQGKNRIGDFLSGKPTAPDENYENMKPDDWCQAHGQCKNITHCSSQETKKLKTKYEELQRQAESYQRKCVTLTTTIKELKDDSEIRQEKFQANIKAFQENLERLREENKRLNQRRLTEGSGFRSEIKLLRDELQRTQKQLCFLTVRKLDDQDT